jgi:hypothetical protein
VPTLAIHAEDDTLQPYRNAVFFSSTIPGARLLRFEAGARMVAFIERMVVRAAVKGHILAAMTQRPFADPNGLGTRHEEQESGHS